MKVLFQCNTVYQLLVAVCLKNEFFSKEECNILISNIMNDSQKIYNRLSNLNMFNKVYIQSNKNVKINKINKIFVSKWKKIKYLNIHNFVYEKYDVFICSNPSYANLSLFSLLMKKNNCIKFFLYEDGISTYSNHYKKLVCNNQQGIRKLLSLHKYLKYISKIFVFKTEYFTWQPTQEIIDIHSLKQIREDLLEKLNFIFGYNNQSLPHDCKKIFFEESFFGDGKSSNDEEIIYQCINKYGSDGFYIKNHPRNKVNRFAGKIKTFPSMSIPWELIILNNINSIEKIQLFTITSASMYTPFILFDLKPMSVSCVNMINDKRYLFNDILAVEEKIIEMEKNISYFK